MKKVYLDNNATTFMKKEVRSAFLDANMDSNASSMYTSARQSNEYIKDARSNIAKLINCSDNEIIFTSGATESNNTVLNIAKKIILKNRKGRILASKIEHPSIREVLKSYSDENIDIDLIDVDKSGIVDLNALESKLKRGDVVLVSIMSANNETGTIQPVEKACALAHKYNAFFHTDATQSIGKTAFDFRKIGADYVSFSSHKVYGPKGVGALIVKENAPFFTFMLGGHQENGRRAGTYNSNAIYGFGVACKVLLGKIDAEAKRLEALRSKLKKGIEEKIDGVKINTNLHSSLSNTLNVSFKNIEGESILLMLDFDGIEVSTGSACATGTLEPSYVLLAQGVSIEDAHSSIRFSFGYENTESDVDYVLENLPPIIEKLRSISTRR